MPQQIYGGHKLMHYIYILNRKEPRYRNSLVWLNLAT